MNRSDRLSWRSYKYKTYKIFIWGELTFQVIKIVTCNKSSLLHIFKTWLNSNTITKRKIVELTWLVFSSFSFWAKTKRNVPWKPKLKVIIRLTLLQNGGFDIFVILDKVCLFAGCLSMKCYCYVTSKSVVGLIFHSFSVITMNELCELEGGIWKNINFFLPHE